MEKSPLQAPTRVKTRREVIGTKCSTHRCPGALQKDRHNKRDRKAYLYVRQHVLEQNHRGYSIAKHEKTQLEDSAAGFWGREFSGENSLCFAPPRCKDPKILLRSPLTT